jgi:ATP/maltotriose-dependent transcriptional regulator MalT
MRVSGVARVAKGKSNAEIGAILEISSTTVKEHLVHSYEKLGVESRHAAALRALEVLSRPPTPNGEPSP